MKNIEIILTIINESNDHLTAEQIFLKAKFMNPKIVLATVYNNLNKLVNDGKIKRVSLQGQIAVYDRIIPHDHLICQNCGKIKDVKLKDITKNINKELNMKIISYDLNIRYICDDCLKQFNQ